MIEMAAVSNATGLVARHPRHARPRYRPRPSRRGLPAQGGRRHPEPDGRRRLRHRGGRAGRLPHRPHRPPPPARGHGPARHGRWPLLHALPPVPPVQHRGPPDLRHADHPSPVEHGAAGPAGLGGLRRGQARPQRRATRSTPSVARPTTALSTPTRSPRRRGSCPSAWPTAPKSSGRSPWTRPSRPRTSRSSHPPSTACGSCRTSGRKGRSTTPTCSALSTS